MLWADDVTIPPNSPWWVAAALGAIMVAYAAARFYFHVKATRRSDAAEQDQHDESKEARRRRAASEEAWQVVDRLNKVIEGYGPKIEALEQKADAAESRAAQCQQDHAATLAALRIVVAWGRAQKNPLPLPDDWIDRLGVSGSDTHRPLPDEGK